MLKKPESKISRLIKLLINAVWYPALFIWTGCRKKQLFPHIKHLIKIMGRQFSGYVYDLQCALKELDALPVSPSFGHFDDLQLQKIQWKSHSLHPMLPQASAFHYSIIIVADSPNPHRFQQMLESVLSQSAKNMEVLIGCNGPQPDGINRIIEDCFANSGGILKKFEFPAQPSSLLLNQLVGKASGNLLLFVDPECWLRPDLMYRYEQTLHLQPDPLNTVLYCSEYLVDAMGELSLKHGYAPSNCIHPPYVFSTQIPACLLIPANGWKALEGMRQEKEGAHFYDMLLRLLAAKYEFQKICLPLCAIRKKDPEGNHAEQAVQSLEDYAKTLSLDWHITPGEVPGTLRAIPQLDHIPKVHAIIPYKNQKKLTLAAVQSLKRQKGVHVSITAVDNRSDDHSIAQELKNLGVEVIRIDEPFNFSRLNNLAVQQSDVGKKCDLLFFMNNDVEMEVNALLEMCRWIGQPNIGIVGCRLTYPNGLLQCGGIDQDDQLTSWQIIMNMTESKLPHEKLAIQRTLRVSDAVTGAATLIKKSTFLSVGGYDEVWYPITFSDINLFEKVKAKGLKAFYTPYASGIHHESMSRILDLLEDYETSSWLQDHYFTHIFPKVPPLSK